MFKDAGVRGSYSLSFQMWKSPKRGLAAFRMTRDPNYNLFMQFICNILRISFSIFSCIPQYFNFQLLRKRHMSSSRRSKGWFLGLFSQQSKSRPKLDKVDRASTDPTPVLGSFTFGAKNKTTEKNAKENINGTQFQRTWLSRNGNGIGNKAVNENANNKNENKNEYENETNERIISSRDFLEHEHSKKSPDNSRRYSRKASSKKFQGTHHDTKLIVPSPSNLKVSTSLQNLSMGVDSLEKNESFITSIWSGNESFHSSGHDKVFSSTTTITKPTNSVGTAITAETVLQNATETNSVDQEMRHSNLTPAFSKGNFIISKEAFDPSSWDYTQYSPNVAFLAFNADDLAFVHTLHNSGWLEVTILGKYHKRMRGWVPSTYWKLYVRQDLKEFMETIGSFLITSENRKLKISNKHQFVSESNTSASSITQSQSETSLRSLSTSSSKTTNSSISIFSTMSTVPQLQVLSNETGEIRQGVKSLLEHTDALNRDASVIVASQKLRALRKQLLREWSHLNDWCLLIERAIGLDKSVNRDFMGLQDQIVIMAWKVCFAGLDFYREWELQMHMQAAHLLFKQEPDNQKMSATNYKHQHHFHSVSVSSQFQSWFLEKLDSLSESALLMTSSSTNLSRFRVQDFLNDPPFAKSRIDECEYILVSYMSLFLGRIDIIEGNSEACLQLELIAHHCILLVKELLYVVKSLSETQGERDLSIETSIDEVLELVKLIIQKVKFLVIYSLNSSNQTQTQTQAQSSISITPPPKIYVDDASTIKSHKDKSSDVTIKTLPEFEIEPTSIFGVNNEAKDLCMVAAKMIKTITTCCYKCRNKIGSLGDFQLADNNDINSNNITRNKHVDFKSIKIKPDEFVSKCTTMVTSSKELSIQHKMNNGINRHIGNNISGTSLSSLDYSSDEKSKYPYSSKYSVFYMKPKGASFLSIHEWARNNTMNSTNSDKLSYNGDNNSNHNSAREDESGSYKPEDEQILIDAIVGKVQGGSFSALVKHLTDESNYPDQFFISTFFLNFRSFGTSLELAETLISRFNLNKKSHEESKILLKRREMVYFCFKTWLESYWDNKKDILVLPTIINFANEGMPRVINGYSKLQGDSIVLIELAARLYLDVNKTSLTTTADNSKVKPHRQIVSRLIKPYHVRGKLIKSLNDILGHSMSVSDFNNILSVSSSSSNIKDNYEFGSLSKIIDIYEISIKNSFKSFNFYDRKKLIHYEAEILDNWELLSESNTKIVDSIDEFNFKNFKNFPLISDFNYYEIAKQLTLMEANMFTRIEPNEFLNQNFKPQRKKQFAPTISTMLLFTNQLSGYVCGSILEEGKSLKTRRIILKQWIKIALACLELQNYSSVASIVTALQSTVISRITKLWSLLNEKFINLFNDMANLFTPDRNFITYRNKLKKVEGCCVPYLGLYLTDIIFANDGNPSFRSYKFNEEHKIINFEKYSMFTNVISDVERYQITTKYPNKKIKPVYKDLEPFTNLQIWILLEMWRFHFENDNGSSDKFWRMSTFLEPSNLS